jgi:hypothetical protein
MNNMWGPREFGAEEIRIVSRGEEILRIKKEKDELLVAGKNMIESGEFARFIAGKESKISIEPNLPELPIVIKPESALSVLPGVTFHCFVSVPLVYVVKSGRGKKEKTLIEASVRSLSRSWFGEPWGGEVAYFLDSPLHQSIGAYGEDDSAILCPVTIVNRSNQILSLDRMILRVPYLSVYEGKSRLYSNVTKISFRGQDLISQVSIQKGAPEVESSLKLAAHPRQTDESGLLSKSFYFIKSIYNG